MERTEYEKKKKILGSFIFLVFFFFFKPSLQKTYRLVKNILPHDTIYIFVIGNTQYFCVLMYTKVELVL